MTEPQVQPHTFLRCLLRQLQSLDSKFPSSEEVQGLGIQAFEVSLTPINHGTLEFDPCFFKPHPDKLLEKYPLLVDHPDVPREDYDWTFIIPTKDEMKDYEPSEQAGEIERVISTHVSAPKQGPSDLIALQDLRNQEYWL
jgi:hypothetical protein